MTGVLHGREQAVQTLRVIDRMLDNHVRANLQDDLATRCYAIEAALWDLRVLIEVRGDRT